MAVQAWHVFKSQSSNHLHDDGRFLLDMHLASPIPRKRARIEIIPLIDIMFFLLASFMMVSLSQTHMKGIKVNLPAQGAPPTTVTKDYIAIRVAAGPVF